VNQPGENADLVAERGWPDGSHQLLQICLIAIAVGVLYSVILLRLAHQWWSDPDYSHGFFIPLFSGLVIWQRRKRLARIALAPSWTGLLLVMFALAILMVGVLGAELFLSRSSLIFLMAGVAVLFAGWKFFKAILFPWAVLFLMVPIPAILYNRITFPLQFLASRFATSLLLMVGVPVLREGNVINLSALSLEVAEACSGIRSLLSLGALAIIYGYFAEKSVWKRIVLAVSSVPVAVAANAFRITGTGLVAQYWDPDKAQGFFHEFSGWLIFLVSVAMLFGLHRLIDRISRLPHTRQKAAA
jgi:exosortase